MLHTMTRMMDSGGSTKRKKEQETPITAAEVVRQTNEAKPNVLPMGFPVITASGIHEIKMPQTQLGLPLVEARSGVPYAERRDTRWEDLFPQAVVPAQTVSVQEDPYAIPAYETEDNFAYEAGKEAARAADQVPYDGGTLWNGLLNYEENKKHREELMQTYFDGYLFLGESK